MPDSPDGYVSEPWGNFVRVKENYIFRATDSLDNYRIIAETPDDLLGPTNSDADTTTPNNYLVCDTTGFKVPVSEGLKEQWDGLHVREKSYDRRHPLDFVRGVPEGEKKGSPRPEQTDQYIEDLYPNGVSLSDLDP